MPEESSDATWQNQLFFNNPGSFPGVDTDKTAKLTPANLQLNNKDGSELNETQLFNEFNDIGKREYTISSASDNSSPSNLLNLNNADMTSCNPQLQQPQPPQQNLIANASEVGLSQKEIVNKRKAQNRAAQRAFRERKEMKLKELEEKLNKSEHDKAQLLKQLEDIKKQNIVISTENKLLAQNTNPGEAASSVSTQATSTATSSFSFPNSKSIDPIKYHIHPNQLTNPDIPYEYKRLTITEVWEYLTEHYDPELKIDEVMSRIKGLEVCHQHGPAYPLRLVDEIAQKSLAGQ